MFYLLCPFRWSEQSVPQVTICAMPTNLISLWLVGHWRRTFFEFASVRRHLWLTSCLAQVLRPDSGDPVQAVMEGLQSAEKVFGFTTNKKGFKVLNNVNVIQGDGINFDSLRKILDA